MLLMWTRCGYRRPIHRGLHSERIPFAWKSVILRTLIYVPCRGLTSRAQRHFSRWVIHANSLALSVCLPLLCVKMFAALPLQNMKPRKMLEVCVYRKLNIKLQFPPHRSHYCSRKLRDQPIACTAVPFDNVHHDEGSNNAIIVKASIRVRLRRFWINFSAPFLAWLLASKNTGKLSISLCYATKTCYLEKPKKSRQQSV